jgi:hypothetical protein
MNGWMWRPTEAEAINRQAPRAKGGCEPGLDQAGPAGLGRSAQEHFGPVWPVSLPDDSQSIIDLLPYACEPLTSSSPRFG